MIGRFRFFTVAGFAATLLAAAAAVSAEPAQDGRSPIAAAPAAVAELSVEVRDAAGAPVAAVSAGDLVVRQAGEERAVLEVSRETRPWRLVLWFDTALSAGPTVPRAAQALEAAAPRLAALGEVEVLVAGDEGVRQVLPPTRDPDVLTAALARLAVFERGEDRLVAMRQEGLRRSLAAGDVAAFEADLVRQRLDLLLERLAAPWAGAADGPGAVFWVGDGYDLDPSAWGRGEAPAAPAGPLAAATAEVARAVAALGWTVVPVTVRGEPGADGPSRFGVDTMETPSGETRAVGTVTLPRRRTAAERAEAEIAAAQPPPPVPVAPIEPLAAFAAASGGYLVSAAAEVGAVVDRLAARLRLRYADGAQAAGSEAAGDEPAGEPQPLTVELAPGDLAASAGAADGASAEPREAPGTGALGPAVVARRWSASPAPVALADLRARRLLDGAADPGAVSVQAAVVVAGRTGGEAALEVEVAPPLPGSTLRLTLAALDEEGRPTVEHRLVSATAAPAAAPAPWPVAAAEDPAAEDPAAELADRDEPSEPAAAAEPPSAPPAPWTFRGTLLLPATAERVAVLVEDPASGAWGGTLAGVVDLSLESDGGWDAAAGVLPGPGPVRLLRPEGAMLAGEVRFETVVSPAVARVELRLDGRRVATVAAAPFAAVLALGRLPLPRRVEAVAYDAAGAELGRDETVVNGGAGSLRVRLVEPAEARAVGAVTVAVDVTVPDDRRLDRVELYWREHRVATLFQPPFRHRLTVPADDPQGLLRAVALLADGGEAEDAVYLNGPGPADRVDVALTELYVVVTDRGGRPLRGLGRADFTVREDGRRQEIATFGDAAELPLTLGLALDTSASMFVKLPVVREAALGVLDDLVPGRDQAFLVEFSDRARLAAAPTRDLDRLRDAAFGLDPGGRTSLWEAVVYSLVQLQGAAGRRALLVYSDGADEDGDVSYRTALAFARRVGVPVYAIVANDEAARVGGLPAGLLPSLGGRIERLAEATGGRAWIMRRNADLAPTYAEIRAELAAQYRLGYYPPEDDGDGWRRVTVDVRRPGAQARTVAGYRR